MFSKCSYCISCRFCLYIYWAYDRMAAYQSAICSCWGVRSSDQLTRGAICSGWVVRSSDQLTRDAILCVLAPSSDARARIRRSGWTGNRSNSVVRPRLKLRRCVWNPHRRPRSFIRSVCGGFIYKNITMLRWIGFKQTLRWPRATGILAIRCWLQVVKVFV